jgi:LmbE family N-acetylglucosaminyl deacetylase
MSHRYLQPFTFRDENEDMTQTPRLLAVLAHPDDESLGLGGVLARYAAEGAETYVVTATRGERGRHGDGTEKPGEEELGRIREAELRAAADVLGVREVHFLDYLDGEVDRADPRQAIGRIAGHIKRLRPHVVVTFAQDGAYGHPDHIAISQFTTAAVVAAAGANRRPWLVAKLYWMAWGREHWDAYQAAFKRLVSTVDGVERQAVPWPDWAITTVIDTRSHWSTVWQAISCHESQMSAYERLKSLSPADHEALWGSQTFYRVFSTVNGGRSTETDVLEGIRL